MSVSDSESGFNQKYKHKARLRTKLGMTKPLAERILNFVFGDKFISVVTDKGCRKFRGFVDHSVNEKIFVKFTDQWSDIFDIRKTISNNK